MSCNATSKVENNIFKCDTYPTFENRMMRRPTGVAVCRMANCVLYICSRTGGAVKPDGDVCMFVLHMPTGRIVEQALDVVALLGEQCTWDNDNDEPQAKLVRELAVYRFGNLIPTLGW